MVTKIQKPKLAWSVLGGLSLLTALFFFSIATVAFAQNTAPPASNYDTTGKTGLVQCGNKASDPCTVEDIFNVFVIGTNLLIGVVGLITIFTIFRAGFAMVTSSGNTEGVTAGKKQLTNAIIGMLLVLLAFLLVNVIIYGLAGARPNANIFNPLQYIGLAPGAKPLTNTPGN